MDTTALVLEITSGLLFAATGMAALLVGTALVLCHAISMDAEQREAPIATREPPRLPARYARRVRGSSTSRIASPSMFTARIRPKSAVDAAPRFHPMTGSRASSSRA